MYAQDAINNPPFRVPDQVLVGHPHGVHLSLDVPVPIKQEALQPGEAVTRRSPAKHRAAAWMGDQAGGSESPPW
jgi:hypothetical protein